MMKLMLLNASDDGDNAALHLISQKFFLQEKKGSNFNFIWMNLDKAALNITYNTGEESILADMLNS